MKWEIIHSEYLLATPWLSVRKEHIRQPSGLELEDFYIIDSQDWVNIIAITEDGLFIVEEQYRHGIQQVCIELCAGIVEDGEDPMHAAKRELLEETGYSGGEWSLIARYCPNASAMTNYCYSFVARGVKKVQEQSLDISENIYLHLITEEEIRQLLLNDSFVESVMSAPLWKYFNQKL